MNMTEEQWARLFLALGQVPTIDAAMNLSAREVAILHELALKGLDWQQQRGFLHYGTGDRLDALDFAQRLSIDPETGDLKPAKSNATQAQEAAQDRLDQFMDNLAHAGE